MFIRESVTIGNKEITIETGRIAKQASGAVMIGIGDTVLLVASVGNKEVKEGTDFFPLTANYTERQYAAGKIPGGFFKREGRPREDEILTCRIMDRPIRPMFPDGFYNEVQVVATLMASDRQNKADVLALIGASASLHFSDIPFDGPVGGIRIGRVDGEFVAFPTVDELANSDMDIVMAATRDAITMVEGEAKEIPEKVLIDALEWGHQQIMPLLDLQDAIQKSVGKTKWTVTPVQKDEAIAAKVAELFTDKMEAATSVLAKHERYETIDALTQEAVAALSAQFPEKEGDIAGAMGSLKKKVVRERVLSKGQRIDGRGLTDIRPITTEVGVLPRVHGSALFTRGETQALVFTTLGMPGDEQRLDGIYTEDTKRFMLHYNFPPYSVGEARPMRGTSRREIGHGALAERALESMLPSKEEFPYAIRIVSEITESNGSSSMASVCGGCMSLMDCGVPIKAPVAGIAMGLMSDGDRTAILSDILGDEDHMGDMDFKVTGTKDGITAVQMDIKIKGLAREIMEKALEQARAGRVHILGRMLSTLESPREELSRWAPRIQTIKVKPDQVRVVIGSGGKTIRGIVEQTGVQIDVQDDGTINVASSEVDAIERAIAIIEGLVKEPEAGEEYEGTVVRLADFGAFVNILPNLDGLLHISEMAWERVEKVEDICKEGDTMRVKVLEVEKGSGKIRLSRRVLHEKPEGYEERPPRPPRDRDDRGGDRGRSRDRGGRDDRGRSRRDDRGRGRDDRGRDDRGRGDDRGHRRPPRDRDRDNERSRDRDGEKGGE
ncbi:MAG: polyribonucleotide nucleotidyltransferase [Deltaproteobacteria bacterium]|nr:polyribonucleotide nucleotidyltransferase [Deltaproteobacteria bacterium]MBN2674403.1 polyribonucleotide nucleotidyltransferase [Deltaproteobacteria bacterium]